MSDRLLTNTLFSSFPLPQTLQQGLADSGFIYLTPIQELTLPVALEGRDVAGQAQTGTGKTCAFLVALMHRLLTMPARQDKNATDPRALIVAPTRELAMQISRDAEALAGATELEVVAVYGGVDYEKQRARLRDGCDIIVATPGRLLDFYKQKVFRLSAIEVMVLDEADRMFDLGFIKDIRYIFRQLPPRTERQVLLYSATLSQRVLELAYEHMNEAEKLVVESEHVTADRLQQSVYFPAREEKLPLLLNLLLQQQPERTIVFVNTRAASEVVRDRLRKQGYRVGMLSGDVPQDKRQRVLKRFKDDQLEILVCTDVAARGLHIPDVSHVFNYDLPQDAEDYVHRIGRTGRLGKKGIAISFACDRYAISLPDIETYIEEKIPVEAVTEALTQMPAPVRAPQADAGSGKSDGTRKRSRRRRKPRAQTQSNDASTTASGKAQADSARSTETTAAADEADHGKQGQANKSSNRRRRRRGGRGRRRTAQGATAATGEHKKPQSHDQQQSSRKQGTDHRKRSRSRQAQGHDKKRQASAAPAQQSAARKQSKQDSTHVEATRVKRKDGMFKRLRKRLFGT